MKKIHEMIIVTCLAACEKFYLEKLIQSITDSKANALAIESINHMKFFANTYSKKLEEITSQLHDILRTDTHQTDSSFLDNLRLSCDELRKQFRTTHRDFILSIDACMKFHFRIHKNHIKYALSTANIYMTDPATHHDIKIKLKSSHDFINENLDPLEDKFKALIEYSNISLTDNSMDLNEDINKHITDYSVQYANKLLALKTSIINKFNFIFSEDLFMKTVCDEILNITTALSTENPSSDKHKLNRHSLFSYETKDTHLAINYINKYLDFFCAPFNDNDKFQTWCSDNVEAISPLSDALSKLLNSRDQRVALERALIGQSDGDTDCLKHGDNYRLKVFFSHISNHALVEFLNSYQDHSIIEKWYGDNKKQITHTQLPGYR